MWLGGIEYACLQKSFNPCGSGSCVEDGQGGYDCICPPGFVPSNYSDTGYRTCVDASVAPKDPIYYPPQTGSSCSAVALSYGLSLKQLKQQNPKINCATNIPAKTRVNVRQASNWAGCAVRYSWNKGDTCSSISSLVGFSPSALQSLNPALDCNSVTRGTQICVKGGTPPARTPPCGRYVPVNFGDTCTSILEKFHLNVFSFLLYNPGINCHSLVASTFKNLIGPMVCVDASEPYGRARAKCLGRVYKVQKYDTCASLIRKYFKNSLQSFKMKNLDFNCFSRKLKIGESICW